MGRDPGKDPFYTSADVDNLGRPLIAKFIKMRLPNASREEQIRATEELREFLAVVYRIYLRLKREGKLGKASATNRREEEEDRSGH